jgi:hypothetical protein
MDNDMNTTEPRKQENIIADYADELKQIEISSFETGVRKARTALFWIAGLVFLGEMIGMMQAGTGFDPVIFVIAILEAGVFIALALWTKKKPYTAVVTGLIAFIGIIAVSAVLYGILEGSEGVLKSLVSGIIVKVVILVTLIKALSDAKALQRAKEGSV